MTLTTEDLDKIISWLTPRTEWSDRKPILVKVYMPTNKRIFTIEEYNGKFLKMELPKYHPFWWTDFLSIHYEIKDTRYVKKINFIHYDYCGNFYGAFIRTDVYPLLWIWYEFLALLDIIWYNVIGYTWRMFKFLNKGCDFIPYNQLVPKNPLEIAMMFGLNAGK